MEVLVWLLSAMAGFFGIVILCDMNRFHIKHYHLTSQKIKQSAKVVMLADLHDKDYGKENIALIKSIEQQHPDFIIMAGDMMNVKYSFSMESVLNLIKKLSERYPIYYAMGNHEQRLGWGVKNYGIGYEEMKAKLQDAGAILLDNQSNVLEEYGICLTGLSIHHKFYSKKERHSMSKDDITMLVGNTKQEKYHILIAHDPEYFPAYASWGADLTLSGHLHGGVMRLPHIGGVISPRWRLFPKYTGGCYQDKNKKMIVSCGLGTHTIPVRIFNPGEIVSFTIDPKKN